LNGLLAIDDTKDADATNTHDKETPAVTVNKVSAQYVTPQPQQVAAVPKTDDNKPWLNKNNPNWSLIVQSFKNGSLNVVGLRNQFKVSKALEAELLSLTN
jgi:myo-inositol-hexaphosphate 3-phosphohydrolase